MDIKLNQDQIEISRQARRFIENECSMDYVRRMFEDGRGFTDEVWAKMVEMGWTAMLVPETYGGLGMELMDLCVVMEEMGRYVTPGPLFSTVLLAGETIRAAGIDAQKEKYLPAIAAGELRGTLALTEPDGGSDPAWIHLDAKRDEGGYVLSGTKIFVLDAHTAQFLIIAARTAPGDDPAHGVTLFIVDPGAEGLKITPLPTMDGTRKQCVVQLESVRVPSDSVLGSVGQGWPYIEPVLRKAAVALCAESVGGSKRCTEMATQYGNERIQFEQPIGGFQAVKHKCAQMFLLAESARSVLYWAAWAQDHGDALEAALSASTAKAYASESYREIACYAIQILAGTGFTWEHDLHFYLKRAKDNETALGDPIYHREELMRIINGEKAPGPLWA
jgi:alkylation response protein AidB-like acyl-CoA dehydrogenase